MTADDAADRDEIQRSLDELRQAWLAAPRVPEPDDYEFARWECLRRLATADPVARCDEWQHIGHELAWVFEVWSEEIRAAVLREARRLANAPIEELHCRSEAFEVVRALVLVGETADLERAVELSVRAAPVTGDCRYEYADPGGYPIMFSSAAAVVRVARGANDLSPIREAIVRLNPDGLANFDQHLEAAIVEARSELDDNRVVTLDSHPELAGVDLTDRTAFLAWAAPRLDSPDPATRGRTWRLLGHGDPASSDVSPATIARAWTELDSDGDEAVAGAAFYLGVRVPDERRRVVDRVVAGMAGRPLASVIARLGVLQRWPLPPDARQWLGIYDIVRPLLGRLRGEPRHDVRLEIGLIQHWPPKPEVSDELVPYRDSAWNLYVAWRVSKGAIEDHLRLLAAGPPVPALARYFRRDARLAGSLLRFHALADAASVNVPWPNKELGDAAREAVDRIEGRHEELTLELLAWFIRRFART